MAAIAPAMPFVSAIGTGLSFVGQMQTAKGMRAAGRAAEQTAEYNKSIRDRNARVADQNAALRERVGGSEVCLKVSNSD